MHLAGLEASEFFGTRVAGLEVGYREVDMVGNGRAGVLDHGEYNGTAVKIVPAAAYGASLDVEQALVKLDPFHEVRYGCKDPEYGRCLSVHLLRSSND